MPYILSNARDSYRQWWTRQLQTYALDAAYAHLNLPYYTYNRHSYPRYTYNRNGYIRPWDISNSGESRFIQHGIPKKKRKPSLNRDEKTKDYRRSENGNWYGKRKGYSFNQADRTDRRQTKQLIKQECYDSLFSVREPANWWDFD